MFDVISILAQTAQALPPTPEAQEIIDRGDPYFKRLCELTDFSEADAIWNTAVNAGIAACSRDFHLGFQMGIALWEQTHPAINR